MKEALFLSRAGAYTYAKEKEKVDKPIVSPLYRKGELIGFITFNKEGKVVEE